VFVVLEKAIDVWRAYERVFIRPTKKGGEEKIGSRQWEETENKNL
jgi:hypothetical protein